MSEIRRQLRAATIDTVKVAQDTVQQSYCLPAEFIGFMGHFPGYPIVPAVVQILMAQDLAEQFLLEGIAVCAIERAKFHRQLKPLDVVLVTCQRKTVRNKDVVDARLFVGDELVTDFWLILDRKTVTQNQVVGV